MKQYLLVLGCGLKKSDNPGDARRTPFELYAGPVIGTFRNWFLNEASEGQADSLDVYVLSARFGLVSMWHPIPPYDFQLDSSRAAILAEGVAAQMENLATSNGVHYTKALLAMGKLYRQVITPSLETYFPDTALTVANRLHDSYGQKTMLHWLRNLGVEFLVPPL